MSYDLMTSLEMEDLDPNEKAKKAIRRVLNAIRDDPYKSYLIGIGTGSYQMLTEAHAALTGQDLKDVRETFLHPQPQNPRDGTDECEQKPASKVTTLMHDDDVIDYVATLPAFERMALLHEILDRFCPRCGGDCVIGARRCGCGPMRPRRRERQLAS